MAPAVNTTLGSTIAPLLNTTVNYNNTTTASALNITLLTLPFDPATTPSTWNVEPVYTPLYVYWYPSYIVYIILVFTFLIAVPLSVIMSAAKRKREAAARNLALQRQRARRQMEIQVTSNNNNSNGNGNGGSGAGGAEEISVLPKNLDLPPSYDEAAFSERKQDSTLTIATSLEASNPNLAVEPPPVYTENAAHTLPANGQPPVV